MNNSDERRITLHKRQERAREAENLLKHPAFVEAYKQVEAAYMKSWATSPAADTELREHAYFGLNALRDVKSKILAVVRDGTIVKMELEGMDKQIKELIGGE